MKIHAILLSAILLLATTSCITDNSTELSNDTSLLGLDQPIEHNITVNMGEELLISPKVTQTNKQKKVNYEWEVDYKLVSREKEFKYVFNEPKQYPCRLKISNGDDIRYYEFYVRVLHSYVQGLYILAEHEGKTILSYLPDEKVKKEFTFDALSKNNNNINFAGQPMAMAQAYLKSKQIALLYIAVGNPAKIYSFDQDEMKAGITYDAKGDVSFMHYDPSGSSSAVVINVNHTLKNFIPLDVHKAIKPLKFKDEKKLANPLQFANAVEIWQSPDLRYPHGFAYFDNANGAIITKAYSYSPIPYNLLPNTFVGDSLIGMTTVDNSRKLALITWNKEKQQYYFYHINPGYYTTKKETTLPAQLIKKDIMTKEFGITKQSVVRSASVKNIVFYSSTNKVYAYNVLSNGNFPTQPLFTIGSGGEHIVDMYVNKEDSKLYIATNDKTQKMPGSIYCYDINTNKVLWKKEHITGFIKTMVYRDSE